jgi:hypothetical protein
MQAGRCQSLIASNCVSATATGVCGLKPAFAGAVQAVSNDSGNCGILVRWTPGTSSCPLTPRLSYTIFRGTVPDFVPEPANRIATCVTGPDSYLDTDSLSSGTTYYYVVRAEDDSTGHSGPCGGGNDEANKVAVPGTPYGPGMQAGPGTWTDGAGDGTSFLRLNVGDESGTDPVWRYVKTSDDPGANHTAGGAFAYRNAGPGASNTYAPNTCSEMQTPPLVADATTINLAYWERHQIEYHWDAIAIEYSVDGGDWIDAPPPSSSAADGCDASDDTSGWESLSCTRIPPINACGYPTTKSAFNGPLGGGSNCNDWGTGALTAYAHRCHHITGLMPGDELRLRWRFSSDPGAEFAGFYLDDVAVTGVRLPNACVPDTCAGQADGAACHDGIACTAGDACARGACQSGAPQPPSEVPALRVHGRQETTLTWTGLPGDLIYDVASSTISSLKTYGTASAMCLESQVGRPGATDPRPNPPRNEGYYYLVRARGACGTGTFGSNSHGMERVIGGCP